MQPGEVRTLAKNLFSSHEVVRQVALSKLATALSEGAIGGGDETTSASFPLIHEGLFYQFWDSDKLERQTEDARRIAKLMENIENPDTLAKWLEELFLMLRRHWDRIDYLRIDKYLMLIRFVLRQFLAILRPATWPLDTRAKLLDSIFSGLFGLRAQTEGSSSNTASTSTSLLGGDKPLPRAALGIPLQFFGIWDEEFVKVYNLGGEQAEEDKEQQAASVDVKLFFAKTLQVFARTEIAELRDRIITRINVLLDNPALPLTKTALVKLLFDNAKHPLTVEASRGKLYEIMRKVQWENGAADSKRDQALSQLMEMKGSQESQDSGASGRKELGEAGAGAGAGDDEDDDLELSEVIPKLLERKNKKLGKRVRKFMDKRREMSEKMRKRAEQMALLGLPLSMWIAEKQRKELLRQANAEWEILKSEIQAQLAKYDIDTAPPRRKKKKVAITLPATAKGAKASAAPTPAAPHSEGEDDEELQAQLDVMLHDEEAPFCPQPLDAELEPTELPDPPARELRTPEATTPQRAPSPVTNTTPVKKGEPLSDQELSITRPSPKRGAGKKHQRAGARAKTVSTPEKGSRRVRFSPKPVLRTFHKNEIVSLKKISSSRMSKSPSSGIIKISGNKKASQ